MTAPQHGGHHPHGLYRVASVRHAEELLQHGLEPGQLMSRAALAVADEAGRILRHLPAPARVALLVGPGNNGGDALLAGLYLLDRGYRVDAFGVAAIRDRAPRPADAALAWTRWQPRPIAALSSVMGAAEPSFAAVTSDDESSFIAAYAADPLGRPPSIRSAPGVLVIDGLFGIGLTRSLTSEFAVLFERLRQLRQTWPESFRLLAIDVPSGLDADRGAASGDTDAPLLDVDATVTMIGDKPGLRTGAGVQAAGRIRIATLQPTAGGGPESQTADGYLVDAECAAPWVPRRLTGSHKGSHGDILVVGGRLGMQGAARLAARGAVAAGAGKVSIAVQAAPGVDEAPVDPMRPEIMRWRWQASGLGRFDVVIAGCGLGLDGDARRWLQEVVGVDRPLVLDADALTLVASDRALADAVRERVTRQLATVLTPHPLEAARLLASDAAAVQGDRIAAATRLATRLSATVVLKGAGTVVADRDGHWAINGSGGPVLATAGTGDVLAGIIGALAAQMPIARAACLGVWAHGAAADRQAAIAGDVGSPAGSVAEQLPYVWQAATTP